MRKLINCFSCHKEKEHFGLDMCSVCLRQYKRRTRPSFYLGTQYSEIKRRCLSPNIGSRYYYEKEFCSKEEYINKFVNNDDFLKQYKIWQNNGYQRGYAPSIDRIDNNKDYKIENLQIIQANQNAKKDWQIPIAIWLDNTLIKVCESQLEASEYIGISASLLCTILSGKKTNNTGYTFTYV